MCEKNSSDRCLRASQVTQDDFGLVLFDTETTGLSANTNAVIQLASRILIWKSGKKQFVPDGAFTSLVKGRIFDEGLSGESQNWRDVSSDDEAKAEDEDTQDDEGVAEYLSGDEGDDLSDTDVFSGGVED